MKKRIIIAIILIILVSGIIIAVWAYKNNDLKTKAIKDVEQLTDLVINGGTASQLSDVLGFKEIQPINIISGEDSYLRAFPDDSVVAQNNLTEYVKANKKFTSNVEKQVKDNFEYNLVTKSNAKEEVVMAATYIKYNFSVYIMDLDALQTKILAKAGVSDDINKYKAKVVAMKILDSKLSVYKSTKQLTTTITYKSQLDDEMKNSLNSYFLKLGGFSGFDENIDELQKSRNERINNYLDEAITTGVVDNSNILSI